MTSTLAALPDIEQLAPVPPVPRTLQETGLSFDTVEQLLIKTLYGAESTGLSLADRMGVQGVERLGDSTGRVTAI